MPFDLYSRARFPRALTRVALVASAAFPAFAQGQQHLRFVASVVDRTGAAIPAVSVTFLARAPGAIPVVGNSDSTGLLQLSLLPGRYLVTLQRTGFQRLEKEIDIPAAGGEQPTFVMQIGPAAESVEVRAESGYMAGSATSATRTPLALLDTPQQVDVLTGELLQARAVESVKQAVELVPAVGLQLGEGRRDNFFIRGFNAVNDMYLDGVRDSAQYYRDLSNTERIEVLEGPAAVLYGRGSSGGLINRISKKPSMEGTLGELGYMAGSYGQQRGTGDLDSLVPATHGKLGLRLTGAAEHEGSQRHFYWADRYTFAPTLLWKPGEGTVVSLQAERLRDDRLPDRGIPYLPATGAPAAVPVGNFYGYVGPLPGSNFIHSAVTDGTLDAKHAFADGWNVHGVQRLAGYATNFENMYATSVTPAGAGDALVGRGEYNGTQLWQTSYTNLEAYRSGHWLGLAHTLLVGVENGREATDSTQYNGPVNQTPVSLLHPVALAPVLSTTLSRNNHFVGRTEAVYVQDLVSLSSRWKALVGVRLDRFGQSLDLRPPTNTTPNLRRTDTDVSPRVGIVYQLRPSASLYGNYSRTFDPSGEGLSLALNNAQLKPEVTQNFEAGGKLELLQQHLLVTASLFRLDRTDIKTTDPNDPTALLNLGEQRTDGAELSFQGSLARGWEVYGGYAWLDGRIVSSTTLSNGVSLQGRRPAMNPLHSGSLWSTYTFRDGLGVGGGLIARDSQFAATDNLAKLPGYMRVDATAFYRRGHYQVQANLQNLGNIRYYDAAQSDYQIYPAVPISGSAGVRWRF